MKLQVHIRAEQSSGTGTAPKGKPQVQAFCPDLPGCSASAPTEAEALRLLRERVDEYFATRSRVAPGTRVISLEV